MSSGRPKAPKEPPSAIILRARQIEDLAKLDEEENRRIKAMLRGPQGGRAFRPLSAPRSSNMPGNTAGSLVSSTGFSVPASVSTRASASPGGRTLAQAMRR